jgi:protein transport protein SEC24
MPPRSRYAVDPSLTAPAAQGQQSGYAQQSTSPQPPYNQQGGYQNDPNQPPHFQTNDRQAPAPTGEYAPPQQPRQRYYGEDPAPQPQQFQQFQQPQHQQQQQHQLQQNFAAPTNHIPAPPHSSGPQMAGPRVRIDPSQVPNPVIDARLDQNLYDDDDFLSCEPRGVMPLAYTDYRGVDQGMFPPPRTTLIS